VCEYNIKPNQKLKENNPERKDVGRAAAKETETLFWFDVWRPK
jgi:hypothetical protein